MGFTTDTEKTAQIRKGLSLSDERVYANIGSRGPLTAAAVRAIGRQKDAAEEITRDKDSFQSFRDLAEQTKKSLAELIHAGPDEIALTNSTTHGIYTTLWSLNWREGDEIVTSTVEHFAIIRPLLLLHERFGVIIRYFNAGDVQTGAFANLFSPRTRLVAVSHVSYSTGQILPVQEITRVSHEKDVPVLVDGAQSAGAIPIDVKALGVNYYSMPGQKWLFGPQGSGALYIRKEIVEGYHPAVNDEKKPWPYGSIELYTDAHRFEPAPPSHLAVAGFGASVEWLLRFVGPDEAYQRISEIGRYIRTALADIPGVTVVTPLEAAGLTSFSAAFADAKTLLRYLGDHGVVVRTIEPQGYVRISFSYYHTTDEADRLLDLLRSFSSSGLHRDV